MLIVEERVEEQLPVEQIEDAVVSNCLFIFEHEVASDIE